MKYKLFLPIYLLLLLSIPLTACGVINSLWVGRNPEEPVVIHIFEAQPGTPSPPMGWGAPGAPQPEGIQQVFAVGDKMFLGIVINKNIKTNIKFFKFTYFVKGVPVEEETSIGSSSDLMKVWSPGEADLLAFNDPWPVPNQPGYYQLNAYIDSQNVVGSALFQVD